MKILHLLLAAAVVALAACSSPTSSGGDNGGGGDDDLNPYAAHHDGTWEAPVSITLGTPFSGKVGSSDQTVDSLDASPGYQSYYEIAGYHGAVIAVKIENSTPAHSLSGDSDYYYANLYGTGGMDGTNRGSRIATDHIWPLFTVADAGTYGLLIENYLNENTAYSLTVLADPVVNEGTEQAPIALVLGEGHPATTAITDVPSYSYYQFSLEEESDVDITYENGQLDATVFLQSTGWLGDFEASENDHTVNHLTALWPAGDYNLLMSFYNGTSAMTQYTLTVTATPHEVL